MVQQFRTIGALLIGALAALAAGVLDHVWLARGGFGVMTVAWVLRCWSGEAFDVNFRRTEYLRGYIQAKAGEDPHPP